MVVKLCPMCATRTMVRKCGTTDIYYECPCGNTVPGTASDRVIRSGGQKNIDRAEMYGDIIRNAPNSRTMYRVDSPCDNCGMPYMTQVRVGSEETVIHVCECGNQVSIR